MNVSFIFYHKKEKKTFWFRENNTRTGTSPHEISPLSPLSISISRPSLLGLCVYLTRNSNKDKSYDISYGL